MWNHQLSFSLKELIQILKSDSNYIEPDQAPEKRRFEENIHFCKIIHFMRVIKLTSLSTKISSQILQEDHCLDVTEEIESTTVLQCWHCSSCGGMVKTLKKMFSLGMKFSQIISSLHAKLNWWDSLTYIMGVMMLEVVILNFWNSQMQLMVSFPTGSGQMTMTTLMITTLMMVVTSQSIKSMEQITFFWEYIYNYK